jgi:predicted DCC family thiol-disulfide oxidoreductase YuxK
MAESTILFDGTCNLCNRAVVFVLRRDPCGYFRFAPLQSEAARRILLERGRSPDRLDTISVLTYNGLLQRSDAVLEIARRLQPPWHLLWGLRYLPRAWRDALYNYVARNRYRWYGRRESCALPEPGWESRFLT